MKPPNQTKTSISGTRGETHVPNNDVENLPLITKAGNWCSINWFRYMIKWFYFQPHGTRLESTSSRYGRFGNGASAPWSAIPHFLYTQGTITTSSRPQLGNDVRDSRWLGRIVLRTGPDFVNGSRRSFASKAEGGRTSNSLDAEASLTVSMWAVLSLIRKTRNVWSTSDPVCDTGILKPMPAKCI